MLSLSDTKLRRRDCEKASDFCSLVINFDIIYDLPHSGMSQNFVHCDKINEKDDISNTRLRYFVLAPRSSAPRVFGRILTLIWGLNGFAQF